MHTKNSIRLKLTEILLFLENKRWLLRIKDGRLHEKLSTLVEMLLQSEIIGSFEVVQKQASQGRRRRKIRRRTVTICQHPSLGFVLNFSLAGSKATQLNPHAHNLILLIKILFIINISIIIMLHNAMACLYSDGMKIMHVVYVNVLCVTLWLSK